MQKSMISDFKSNFSKIKKDSEEIASICRYVSELHEIDIEKAAKYIEKTTKAARSMKKNIERAGQLLPQTKTGYNIKDTEPSARIEETDGVYHFTLDKLLPHRTTYNQTSNSYKYVYDRDELFSGFKTSIDMYIKDNNNLRLPVFDHNIGVLCISHYPGVSMVDPDNLGTKEFVDSCITGFLVPDDSPEFVTLIVKGDKEGSKCFTEVYAGDIEKVKRLL